MGLKYVKRISRLSKPENLVKDEKHKFLGELFRSCVACGIKSFALCVNLPELVNDLYCLHWRIVFHSLDICLGGKLASQP